MISDVLENCVFHSSIYLEHTFICIGVDLDQF